MYKTCLQISSEGKSRVCGRSLTLASMCFLLVIYRDILTPILKGRSEVIDHYLHTQSREIMNSLFHFKNHTLIKMFSPFICVYNSNLAVHQTDIDVLLSMSLQLYVVQDTRETTVKFVSPQSWIRFWDYFVFVVVGNFLLMFFLLYALVEIGYIVCFFFYRLKCCRCGVTQNRSVFG